MNSPEATGATASGPRRKRAKVGVACDVCRRRKSRCDGRRPKCGHCLDTDLVCSYQGQASEAAVATEETASSTVDSQLLSLNSRLSALERRIHDSHGPPNQDSSSTVYDSGEDALVISSRPDHILPDFHHGANHKVFQYWARLRVRMTLPGVSIRDYQRDAEKREGFEGDRRASDSNGVHPAEAAAMLAKLESRREDLHLPMKILLETAQLFDVSRIISRIALISAPVTRSLEQ